jgi:prolyl-tRNA synthetase
MTLLDCFHNEKGKCMQNHTEEHRTITPRNEDFSRWYLDVIARADLMDYAPVKGCIVFKPDGYAIWEYIQQTLDALLKKTGHRNAYFPLFIPERFFHKEKAHVEGFDPELPWVTEAGGERLEERLAVRPTSETMIGHMFARWITSHRDLPLLINQWANVVRWEKRTLPFLRTSEFLWQEGHTAHENEHDAREETERMLALYASFVEEHLAIPTIAGQKTESEKFAGAVDTYSIEAMMQDGRAVQAGTSHYMGTNFAKAFEIMYSDRNNTMQYVHTTSWGVSTRLIGAMIMVHSDDRGLVLPPLLAPTQAVIVPIGPASQRAIVHDEAMRAYEACTNALIRVRIDDRTDVSPGWKFCHYELHGVPIRIEIGPRDVQAQQAVLVSRITGEKRIVSRDGLAEHVTQMLASEQRQLRARAAQRMHDNTKTIETLDAWAKEEKPRGFAVAGWCGSRACESTVKTRTGATSRNIPHRHMDAPKTCLVCGAPSVHTVIFARAY